MWAVIGSGQSLNERDISLCIAARSSGKLNGIAAISNVALDFVPSADAIVSHDSKWWRAHPKALELPGEKWCREWGYSSGEEPSPKPESIRLYTPSAGSCNSGLFAMEIAHKKYGAERILLLGQDFHGTHYFGPYSNGLKNTSDSRFAEHIRQFEFWNGCPVINCSPGSALKKFPLMPLDVVL